MSVNVNGFDEVVEKQIQIINEGTPEESINATNNYIRLVELKQKVDKDNKEEKSKFVEFIAKYGIKLVELGFIGGLALLSFKFERTDTYSSTPGKSVMQSIFRKPTDGLLK